MPRLFASASSQYLEKTSAVVLAYPLTMAVWYNPTTSNATGTIVGIGNSTLGNNYIAMGVASTAKPFLGISPAGAEVDLFHGTSVTNGRWGHIASVIASSTSKALYFNGGTPVTDATSTAMPTVDRTNIGALSSATRISFSNGIIAHAAIWNVALNDDEVRLLASGVYPLQIRPANLVSYVPVWGTSPESDMMNTPGYAVSGATISTNRPPVSSIVNNNYQQLSVPNGISVSMGKIR